MSCTFNGHELPALRDTPGSRCLAILENGLARFGIRPAPAAFNRILAAPVNDARRIAGAAAQKVRARSKSACL